MEYKYTILFVDDVLKTIEMFEKAFKMKRKFVHDSKTYGELDTGSTSISFATFGMLPGGRDPNGYTNFCLSFVSNDVENDYQHAINNHAMSVEKPHVKPWGQTSCFVRVNGILVELCSKIS